MTHKDLDGKAVNTNCTLYQMFPYWDLTTPEILLLVKNETAQCASSCLSYKSVLIVVVWLDCIHRTQR